jgi:hypothetical protein
VTQTLQREEAQIKALFDQVEAVEEVAESIQDREPAQATKLRGAVEGVLSNAGPVRIRTAASLLCLSDRTARTWAAEGVLALASEHPMRVDPVRLHEVLRLVKELRAAGRNKDLLNAVWHRLQDAAVLDRDDLATSLRQLRDGRLEPALTKGEQAETPDH